MPGPAPKHASTRARTNKAATRATLRPHSERAPELPERDESWHSMTAAWWSDVWSSPMSPEWDESDVHNVYILAAVYDHIWTAESARDRLAAAAEYRQQRKDLGLTPYDRRRLEWTIESAEESKERGNARRSRASKAATATAPADDPRGTLYAV